MCFDIDDNGILNVSVEEISNGLKKKVRIVTEEPSRRKLRTWCNFLHYEG